MLVLTQDNSYGFASMVISVTDNTVESNSSTTATTPIPSFNVLIPTVQPVGVTNTLELYYPNEQDRYIADKGDPDATKNGFGPNFIHGILERGNSGVGVYTVNLRGASASIANTIAYLKYKIDRDVPYTDEDGNQYYVDVNGQLVTVPTDATPVMRDVLHVKTGTEFIEGQRTWVDLMTGMNALFSDVPDVDGYMTIPLFSIMYRGASAFGNNSYFNMMPRIADYDGKMYYAINCFDGLKTINAGYTMSFDRTAGANYGTSYYIESLFNSYFPALRFMTSDYMDNVYTLFNEYLFTLDDYIAGTTGNPSKNFGQIDMFNCNEFAIVTDLPTIDTTAANAFSLVGGFDGTETRDELFESFFKGEIMSDITSVLRYNVQYIPDTGYNDATKKAIIALVENRVRMTSAGLMIGGTDGFGSALLDNQANYYTNMPNIRKIATYQSPMMTDPFTQRTIVYPASYFDTMAMMDHFIRSGNYFQPFAGYNARWTGYIEDTMPYPPETVEFINSLQTSRINVVMKDYDPGGYLSDQQMSTILTSDQTELNNAFLISAMLRDLMILVHQQHFKFNEAEQVRVFKETVNNTINSKYVVYSAALTVDVVRLGTVGREKSVNKITVAIDMFDINRHTNVEIILQDT